MFDRDIFEKDFTYGELQMIQQIGRALRIPSSKVIKTPYLALIGMLVAEVENLNSKIQMKDDVIESVKTFIKENDR